MNSTTDDNENANELKFGEEFSDVMSLSIDAIYLLLDSRKKMSARTGIAMNEAFEQTFSYVERLATTQIISDLDALTKDLEQKLGDLQLDRIDDRTKKTHLHSFEAASLANLIKDDDTTTEEILSLLPSLSRFPVDQLEILINIVVEAKERATGSL